MPEDLTTSDPEETKGINPDDVEDVVWDETSAVQYVEMGIYVINNLEEIDIAMLSKTDQLRVRQMKKWALRIAHHYMKDIYTDLMEPEDEE